ncbi:uncharacterized protein LOC125659646 isoform X2 [Ostrea edulis]|uniref:uncharacterized protein LOC125659646 isoform X2 n=1 Tax=Ostrea edulis TaxID=37623 RepID=UPI002095EE77|nr:uncharacterized protein LOC125659646 isoform X2 [Ostrea edulis]
MNLSGLFRFCFPVLGTVLYFCQDVSSVVQFNVTSQSGKMLTVGETFRASCDVGGYTPIDLITNLQVHWKSENGDICLYGEKTKDAPEKYVCSSISGQGISSFVLAVPDVSMEDSGNYTCEVEEKKTSSAMKSSVELQVIELTTVTGKLCKEKWLPLPSLMSMKQQAPLQDVPTRSLYLFLYTYHHFLYTTCNISMLHSHIN